MVLYTLPEMAVWQAENPENARAVLVRWLAFWPSMLHGQSAIYSSQPVMMFATYGFLHTGLFHFACNVVLLAILGFRLVRFLGAGGFLLLYIVCQISGAVAYAALADTSQPMVGASGALFGLAGAALWQWSSERPETRRRDLVSGTAILVVGNLALGGHVAWQAHLGGFLAGAGIMAALIRLKMLNVR